MAAPPSSASAAGPLLEARGISKRYGGIQALDGVDLSVGAGEVLGLVGENGAGKSTLVRILTGVETADAGEMRLAGTPYAPRDPAAARAAGVAVIHQQFEFVDSLSVAENLFLHALPVRRRLGLPVVDRPRMRREAAVLLGRLQIDLDPGRPVGELSLAERQLLEIARVLAAHARLLVLDEPTASLERRDVERLFGLVRRARGEGTGVVFISHRLDE
ncbi:MAG: sugar ABC transporter ATP-binding protein, partial [Candidatus Rokubacteria bacterium]|nr:sugar ABC transporter ATP-binding protein [Candidatus Rokubacteria bacterium]